MEKKEVYIETVEECGKIRYKINENLHKGIMKPLGIIFKYLTNSKFSDFKLLNDMNYYAGGYPNINSLPKIVQFMDQFETIVKWYEKMGEIEYINELLLQRGIEINIKEKLDDEINFDFMQDKKDKDKFVKAWKQIFNEKEFFTNKKQVITELLDIGYDTQKEICELADVIKIEYAEQVEEACKIKKPNFIKTVLLKYKEKVNKENGKEEKKDLEKVTKDIHNLQDAISIF